MYNNMKQNIIIISLVLSFILSVVSLSCIQNCYADSFLKTKVETIDGPRKSGLETVKQVLRNLDVPKEIGFIKEIHVPKNPAQEMIINIQDLHCNYQAQKNIAKILDYLCTTYGIRMISVEGGSGKIDTTFYKELPDEKIKEQVADYFLREARINGTEYFAITTKRDIALYGAEDEAYYDKNLEAFLKALPERERILEAIAMLENDLNIIKSRIYNKKLNELDDNVVDYDNGEMTFENYMVYIAGLYPEDKLKQEFAQVTQLVEAIRLKAKLGIEKAEAERKELIDYLTKNLARNELEEFLKATVEFKAKTMDALAYHNTLKKLYAGMDKKTKTLGRAWPQLSKYIEYLNKHETLDKFGLFSEMDSLVERIKNGFYTSYTQKMLDHNLKVIRLARNLYSTKLLNRDLTQVKKYESDFKAQKFRAYVEREAKRLKLELALPRQEDMEAMEKTLPDLENFYYYASQRNNILAVNTLNGMTQEKESVGVLVTGGFHTDGIAQYLEEKRVSYVVICPVIDKLDDNDERYINALKGRKTPFEEQLEREEPFTKQNVN